MNYDQIVVFKNKWSVFEKIVDLFDKNWTASIDLQERSTQKAQGTPLAPAMLFFGCRHPEQDYLYESELAAFALEGVVELHTAFSRAEAQKTYVQDLLAVHKTVFGN